MSGGEATLRIRMQHARSGNPPLNETVNAIPVGPVLLTPTDQCPPPEPSHPLSKCAQAVDVSRYRVVVEVALYDRLEPFSRLLDRIVHAFAKLRFDFPHLRPHALPDGLPLNGKLPVPVFPADMREPQKVERLRLAFPSSFPVLLGEPPEFDPARFVWMKSQPKLPQP